MLVTGATSAVGTAIIEGNYSGAPSDGEWLADKDSRQGSKHSMALLAHSGEIPTDATKGRCPILAAKGSRNLLLTFEHP